MKYYRHQTAALLLGCALLLSSCEEMNKPLAGGGMLMSPGMAPSGVGRTNSALLDGGMGRMFASRRIGYATPEQKVVAINRGRSALQASRVKKGIAKRKVEYVSVPVRRAPGQKNDGGTPVMKVNADTGEPTGDVYATTGNQKVKDGDMIKLGGDPTLYFSTPADQL